MLKPIFSEAFGDKAVQLRVYRRHRLFFIGRFVCRFFDPFEESRELGGYVCLFGTWRGFLKTLTSSLFL